MAIRFDASAESAARTANLPSATSFTMMCWGRLAADRNAFSTIMSYGNDGGAPTIETAVDGTTIGIYNGASSVAGTNLSVGVWYHFAWTFDDTNHRLYVNGVLDATHAKSQAPATKIWFGNDQSNEWLNGLTHGAKIWSAVLTSAEIRQEMQQIVPIRWASLNSWYPMDGNLTAMLQEGGRQYPGRVENVLTAAGTLAWEQGPLVPWQQKQFLHIWDVPTLTFMPRSNKPYMQAVPRASSW